MFIELPMNCWIAIECSLNCHWMFIELHWIAELPLNDHWIAIECSWNCHWIAELPLNDHWIGIECLLNCLQVSLFKLIPPNPTILCGFLNSLFTYRWYGNVSFQDVVSGNLYGMGLPEVTNNNVERNVGKHCLDLMGLQKHKTQLNYTLFLCTVLLFRASTDNSKFCNWKSHP